MLQIPSPLSPAHLAGLLPHSDYIIGTPSGTLRGESAFGELVEDHLNRSLVLWVYNSEFDVVREVELVPRRGWGGEGALGAILGYGALHRLPVALSEEVNAPGEVMFGHDGATEQDQGEPGPSVSEPADNFFTPATLASPQLAPPPMVNLGAPPPKTASPAAGRHGGRRNRNAGGVSPSRAFDDYFAEEAQKSKAADFAPSRTGSVPPPPPKTTGGPPQSTASPAPGTEEESEKSGSEEPAEAPVAE